MRKEETTTNQRSNIRTNECASQGVASCICLKSAPLNLIIMWCSWKVFVCRHDSGDGFIAYIFFPSFLHSHKVHFKCYTKHFECGASKPALARIRHKNRATTTETTTTTITMTAEVAAAQKKNQIRATIVRIFTSYIQSIFIDGRDRLKKIMVKKTHCIF